MNLAALLDPLRVDELIERYFGQRALLRVRDDDRFSSLLTLEELELRINDGTASLDGLAVIGRDGRKLPDSVLRVRQPGRSWSPTFVRKSRLHELLAEGHSCVLHNMSQLTPRLAALIASIEAAFPGYQADAHIYFSPGAGGTAFSAHRDQPQHKIYLQLHGSTHWTVFRGSHPAVALDADEARQHLSVDFEARLTPGSVLYLPPGVFHRVESRDGARVSVSIPFTESPDAFPVDRHYVPLAALLRLALGDGDHSNSKSDAEKLG